MTRGDDDLQDTYFMENFTHGETCLKFDPVVSFALLFFCVFKKTEKFLSSCRFVGHPSRLSPGRDAAPG